MVRHIGRGISLLIVLLLPTACDSGASGLTEDAVDDGSHISTVSAMINEVRFRGTAPTAGLHRKGVLHFGGVEKIDAAHTNQLIIDVINVTGPGTYFIGSGSMNSAVYYEIAGQHTAIWAAVGGTGTVTVTQLSTSRAVGTFSLTLQPSLLTGASGVKNVTAGRFDILLYNP